MGDKLDSIQEDILLTLSEAPKSRLQRKEIRDKVYEKYEDNYGGKDTFNVVLQRKLNDLVYRRHYLEKDNAGHQEVYYYIPPQQKGKIMDILDRKKTHDFVDTASPEEIGILNEEIQRLKIAYEMERKYHDRDVKILLNEYQSLYGKDYGGASESAQFLQELCITLLGFIQELKLPQSDNMVKEGMGLISYSQYIRQKGPSEDFKKYCSVLRRAGESSPKADDALKEYISKAFKQQLTFSSMRLK